MKLGDTSDIALAEHDRYPESTPQLRGLEMPINI
jgi:hypothetical protein